MGSPICVEHPSRCLVRVEPSPFRPYCTVYSTSTARSATTPPTVPCSRPVRVPYSTVHTRSHAVHSTTRAVNCAIRSFRSALYCTVYSTWYRYRYVVMTCPLPLAEKSPHWPYSTLDCKCTDLDDIAPPLCSTWYCTLYSRPVYRSYLMAVHSPRLVRVDPFAPTDPLRSTVPLHSDSVVMDLSLSSSPRFSRTRTIR